MHVHVHVHVTYHARSLFTLKVYVHHVTPPTALTLVSIIVGESQYTSGLLYHVPQQVPQCHALL